MVVNGEPQYQLVLQASAARVCVCVCVCVQKEGPVVHRDRGRGGPRFGGHVWLVRNSPCLPCARLICPKYATLAPHVLPLM